MRKSNNIHSAAASKGMYTDAKPEYQPPNTSRFALNAVLESTEGDMPAITNELGTELCGKVKDGYTIIGAKQLDGDQFVIFSTNGTNSEIGIHNQVTCEYVTLVNADCLGFKLDKRIKALFRIFKGCERVVYFTDGINPYRVINVDNLQSYYEDGVFKCESLELSRPHEIPCINSYVVQDGGGQLELGTYTFRIRLLDSDLNPTNWFLHTPTIPVVDDALSNAYATIDGGKNIGNTDITNGGVPLTNKSILLNLDSLDTNFAYYQLAVILRTESTGFVNAAYELQPKPIVSDTSTYIYVGPNPNTDVYTQLTALSVDPGIIDVVEAHAQIDNRLFLGNMSYSKYNYGAMQRAANLINSEYEYTSEVYANMKYATPKSPKAYVEHRTHMRDEVYAYAIRGWHKKGWATPPLHIPGRSAIVDPQLINLGNSNPHYRNKVTGLQWDTQLLTVIADGITPKGPQVNLADVQHLSLKVGDTVPRWRVYNTAIQYANTNRGKMAYYECDENYPLTQDCDGNYIYPVGPIDLTTGKPTPQKIRHHKYPDTTLVPMYSTTGSLPDTHIQYFDAPNSTIITPYEKKPTFVYPIGIAFDLDIFFANLPQDVLDDFVEWEIMVAVRDEFNKTVLDKGYIISTINDAVYQGDDPNYQNEVELAFPDLPSIPGNPSNVSLFAPWCISGALPNERFNVFLSPKETFLRKYLNGTHYKNERTILKELIDIGGIGQDSEVILDLSIINQDLPYDYPWQYKNRKITSSIYLDHSRPIDNVFSIYTKDQGNFIYNMMYTKHILHNTTQDPLISNLKFAYSSDGDIINTNPAFVNGISYASIKLNRSVYSNLPNIKYRSINACFHKFTEKPTKPPLGIIPYAASYSGDSFIAKLSHRLASNQHDKWTVLIEDWEANSGQKDMDDAIYMSAFYESEINSELRFEASPLDKKYLKKDLYQTSLEQFFNFLKPLDEMGNQKYWPEFFGYNIDFSAVNDEIVVSGLPFTYDYCSKCDNKFPFRLRYSEKSFQDQVTDKYRIFLPGNFTDLPGETLAINNLFVAKEELYAHTSRALYFVPTRAHTMQTNEATVYLGTGDIFSIPPRRIASPDYAYAGSTDAFATQSTEFGAVFIDPVSGKVFILRDGLKEISNAGQRNFFEENLKLTLNEYAKENFGKEYPYLSPTHPIGIGYTATFDTRHRRYIIHKKDYNLLYPDGVILSDVDGFVKKGQALKLSDSKLFEDKSFTMSFTLGLDNWTSFHSYMPQHMWHSENNYFSSTDNNIWKHNAGEYTTYYDKPKSDFILELISNPVPGMTKTFGPIQLVHDSQIFDTTAQLFKDVYDVSFDRAVFSGSDISTGLLKLQPQTFFSSVNNTSNDTIDYERKGRLYNINNIIDVVKTDEPLFTKDWAIIQPDYFIDKVVNADAIDHNKSLFTRSRMTDRFMSSRLYFNPDDNIKITFEALVSEFKPFIR